MRSNSEVVRRKSDYRTMRFQVSGNRVLRKPVSEAYIEDLQ